MKKGFCYQENTHFSQAVSCGREEFWKSVRSAQTQWKIDSRRDILDVVASHDEEGIKRWLNKDNEQEQEELQQAVHDIVINMDEPCKTILWSYYWGGNNMKEIAEMKGYNNADVAKSQKSRCLSKVKLALVGTFNREKR